MALVTISNVSNQTVPILVEKTTLANSDAQSDISYFKSESTHLQPGTDLTVEAIRVDLAQLDQQRRLGSISFVQR
tara:strand:- start:631 stop:855 length:225 start_codon:yes stop_codon:yes gene_type:complete